MDVLELVLGVTRTPAMERAGLDFTIPGMHVFGAAAVAREGLDPTPARGPVRITGGNGDDAARNDPDRAERGPGHPPDHAEAHGRPRS